MALKVFVSYSHKDSWACEELLDHIGGLRHLARIIVFSDREVKPGEDWDARIMAELRSADVVIFLLTPGFIGSRYCTAIEMVEVLDLQKPMISVLVRNIDFHGLPLAKFQMLPKDNLGNLKAISDWHGKFARDRAWMQVAIAIRGVLQTFRQPDSITEPLLSTVNAKPVQYSIIDYSYERIEESKVKGVDISIAYTDDACDLPIIERIIKEETADYLEFIDELEIHNNNSDYHIAFSAKTTFKNENFQSVCISISSFLGGAHGGYDVLGINFETHNSTVWNLKDIVNGGKDNESFARLLVERIVSEKIRRIYGGNSIHKSEIDELSSEVRTNLDNTEALTYVIFGASESGNLQEHHLTIIFPHYSMGSYAEGSYSIDIELEKIEPDLTQWAKDILFH